MCSLCVCVHVHVCVCVCVCMCMCACVCVYMCACACVCVLTAMPVVVAYVVGIIPYALQQAVLTDCLILLPPGSKTWRALINIHASSQQQNDHHKL